MSTITRELAKLFRKITNSEIDAEGNAHVVLSPADSLLINNARIALASLEAEPYGYVHKAAYEQAGSCGLSGDHEAYRDSSTHIAVYTAQPAPASVPDYPETLPCPVMLEPGLRFGKGVPTKTMLGALQRRAEYYAELEAMTPEQRAEHEAGMKEFAAMLQGAEPVTTAYKLPFEQWLSQQTVTIDVECGCVMTEVFFHWLRVAYEAGNSPVIPDCSCLTCRPVTFTDSRFVVCPECGNKRCPHANDHRNACTGSNEPGQEGGAYPAAPQQEVKP
ncbi:hypothetical protein Q9Z36_004219 [Enterobacter asburiae]